MGFVVLDFEATCWDGYVSDARQEIIEIGAFFVSPLGERLGKFESFVQPSINPILSLYCKNLTGIAQKDMDSSELFPEVFSQLEDRMIALGEGEWNLVSWGRKDHDFWTFECERAGLEDPFEGRYIDVKEGFAKIRRLPKKVGLNKALTMENMEFEGREHRALDDAAMLLNIFMRYFGQWRL